MYVRCASVSTCSCLPCASRTVMLAWDLTRPHGSAQGHQAPMPGDSCRVCGHAPVPPRRSPHSSKLAAVPGFVSKSAGCDAVPT